MSTSGSQTLRVSVVIPTIGRDSLRESVASAARQTLPPHEIIVVCDSDHLDQAADLRAEFSSVEVMYTGGGHGANSARQLGINTATGEAIALLDDDDTWYPEKLSRQSELFARVRRAGYRPVISCGADVVDTRGTKLYSVPRRTIQPGQSVSDYLFKRREIPHGEATLGSSTLLFDRSVGLEVPFRTEFPLHQDWDWLMRAQTADRVTFEMSPDRLLAYRVQARGQQMSRGPHWARSIEWADSQRGVMNRREYGDFVLTVSVYLAVDAGARWRAARIALRAFRHGTPGFPAIVVGLGLLVLPRERGRTIRQAVARTRAWPTRDEARDLPATDE